VKLTEIRSTLREIGVSPVKTLGQNFLHDRNLARWIAEQAEIAPQNYVVEIGPGLGALTEFILAKGAHVLAIEKDGRLANFLRERFVKAKIDIEHGDALEFDARTLLARPRVKLLGNLPYNIASVLLLRWLTYPSPFSLVILMLQKEMAERLAATPGTKNYGALSVQMQFRYRIKLLRTIRASNFFPEPDVDSAVVRLEPRDARDLPACDADVLVDLVRRGFGQRRKQLGKLLREQIPNWNEAAAAIDVDAGARAETLSLEQWIALTNFARPIQLPEAKEELFPVVDKNDRILRAAPRGEVHANNLLHRAVHILIFNPAGEVFLQWRARTKDRHPLRWDSSAAGHVDAGEDYAETAGRELEEELGIKTKLEEIARLPASDRTDQEFVRLYRGEYEGAFVLNRSEIEAGEYFPPAIVTGWIAARPGDFAPGFAECWKAFCASTQRQR
jgi:16S rRNA (adenine1518-N6/adenine1519-N6)-dimethyltransferase